MYCSGNDAFLTIGETSDGEQNDSRVLAGEIKAGEGRLFLLGLLLLQFLRGPFS